MAEPIRITTPFTEDVARKLKAGDSALISGIIYTGRDAAHKRMTEALGRGEELPVDLTDQIIYYVGPSPAKLGQPIGSAGSDYQRADGWLHAAAFGRRVTRYDW